MNTTQLEQELKSLMTQDFETLELLPLLRKYQKTEEGMTNMDELSDGELQYRAFNENRKGELQALFYCYSLENALPSIEDSEPEEVLFVQRWDTLPDIRDIAISLLTIVQSDCSGCCNALDFINLSRDGIVARGNVSMTYHS